MTDDSQSPPAPRLPDEYYVPADIRKLLGQVPPPAPSAKNGGPSWIHGSQ
jgi:hypothetical protein